MLLVLSSRMERLRTEAQITINTWPSGTFAKPDAAYVSQSAAAIDTEKKTKWLFARRARVNNVAAAIRPQGACKRSARASA